MQIIEKNIDELIPYENNPRVITQKAIKIVAQSIKDFGFKVPIVIDSNNVIINGHTRLKASKLLALTKVPCIIADDLTEEQSKAFRLIDNRSAEFTSWDWEVLNSEMEELLFSNEDFDLSSFDENQPINLDDFFADGKFVKAEPKKDVQIKRCPHCNEVLSD